MMEDAVEAELCFPHFPNSSCRKPQTHTSGFLLSHVLICIASTLTSSLNLLVIIAIAHFRQLHSSTNFILLSLAVADFVVGLVVMPAEGFLGRGCWTLGDLLCALYFFLPCIFIVASTAHIVLISVDRYVAICNPLHYQKRMTENVVSVSILMCWLYALICAFLLLSENLVNLGKYRSCLGECNIYFPIEVDIVVSFALPVSIIVVLYTRVFLVVVTQARAMRSGVMAQTSRTIKKSELKAARNLGIIVVVFLICYSPFYCVAYSGIDINILGMPLYIGLFSLIHLNSCINPLLYVFLYPWFRKAVKVIVTLQIVKAGSSDLKFAKKL